MKRHPQHILTQLDARLEAGYSKERIRKELNISRSSIYEIIDNLANWGSHYPPKGWNRKKLGPDYKMDLEQRNVSLNDGLKGKGGLLTSKTTAITRIP